MNSGAANALASAAAQGFGLVETLVRLGLRPGGPLARMAISCGLVALVALQIHLARGLTVLHFANNHLEYALTWFALAATSLAVTAVFILKRPRAGQGHDRTGGTG